MNDSLVKLIFSFNDLETKYQYKFLNRKWKKFVELSNIDNFSHLLKNMLYDGNRQFIKYPMKYFFTKPCDIVEVEDGLELFLLKTVPRVTFIKKGIDTSPCGWVQKIGDLFHGFVVPNNGISKIVFSVEGFDYEIYDYKIVTSRYIQYKQNPKDFYYKTESEIKWINPFTQPINLTASPFYTLKIAIYDKDKNRYQSMDFVYSYMDDNRRRLHKFPVGKLYGFEELKGKCYIKNTIIFCDRSNHLEKEINYKLIARVCRKMYKRMEIVDEFLYKDLTNIVLGYLNLRRSIPIIKERVVPSIGSQPINQCSIC